MKKIKGITWRILLNKGDYLRKMSVYDGKQVEFFNRIVQGHWQKNSNCLPFYSCQKEAKLGTCQKSLIYMHSFDTRGDGRCGSADDTSCISDIHEIPKAVPLPTYIIHAYTNRYNIACLCICMYWHVSVCIVCICSICMYLSVWNISVCFVCIVCIYCMYMYVSVCIVCIVCMGM